MSRLRAVAIWGALLAVLVVPVLVAATSEFLAYRDTIYIISGFAGIAGMALLLLQPLLVGGYLPGLERARGRLAHRWIGAALLASVTVHVAGLWLTSPPDVIDALFFRSPTPFSVWGVLAMWALFFAALLAAFRRLLGITPAVWRAGHTALVASAVLGTVVHALLIEGTMGFGSKIVLCVVVLLATVKTVLDLKVWSRLRRRA